MTSASGPVAGAGGPALAVIDTNAVLDWLVFRDPRIAPLVSAVERAAVRWVIDAPTLEEIERMLVHPSLARWKPESERLLATIHALAIQRPAPAARPAAWPRCSDPDDQMFIDLALAEGAAWLVTRDRALLKLRRRAAAFGLAIVVPEAWRPRDAAPAV